MMIMFLLNVMKNFFIKIVMKMLTDKIDNFDKILDDLDSWMAARKYFHDARTKGVKELSF